MTMKTHRFILLILAALFAFASVAETQDWTAALNKARPGAQWAMGDTYESLQWLDAVQTQPTKAELQAAWETVLTERAAAEAERAADTTETAQLKAMIQNLRDGAGTTAQRLQRLERCMAHVLKTQF